MKPRQYILAGFLIDGTGTPAQKRMLLTIKDGRIAAIEKYSTDSGPDPSQLTDLSHCTLVPPLVDAHVHLGMSGTIDAQVRERQLTAGYKELRPVITRHLRDLFSHGVFAVRDAGDRGDFALRYRDEEGVEDGLVLRAAGRAWHGRGKYGSFLGRAPEEGQSLAVAFTRDAGTGDTVKLINSGLVSLSIFGREPKAHFNREEIAGLVAAAAGLSRKVMVHANGREAVRAALEAGCHSLEHGFFMGEENLALMAEKGIFWVPTVFALKAYAANLPPTGSKADLRVIDRTIGHQLKQMAAARELGVQVALGTDAGGLGILHGESMVEEIKLFIRAGYSLEEAIGCATGNGARLLDVDLGLLVKGNPATFLVTRGVPSQLPRKLGYLEGIYIDGKPSAHYRKNPVKAVVKRDAKDENGGDA